MAHMIILVMHILNLRQNQYNKHIWELSKHIWKIVYGKFKHLLYLDICE